MEQSRSSQVVVNLLPTVAGFAVIAGIANLARVGLIQTDDGRTSLAVMTATILAPSAVVLVLSVYHARSGHFPLRESVLIVAAALIPGIVALVLALFASISTPQFSVALIVSGVLLACSALINSWVTAGAQG